jgi:hypothetical protein
MQLLFHCFSHAFPFVIGICAFRSQITDKEGIPADLQLLLFNSRLLQVPTRVGFVSEPRLRAQDEQNLHNAGLRADCTVQLMISATRSSEDEQAAFTVQVRTEKEEVLAVSVHSSFSVRHLKLKMYAHACRATGC